MNINNIDEAIAHCKEIAKSNRKIFDMCPYTPEHENGICLGLGDCKFLTKGKDNGCLKCAKEHEEFACWLEELKELRKFVEDNKLLYEVDIKDVAFNMSPCADMNTLTWYNLLVEMQKCGYVICEKK